MPILSTDILCKLSAPGASAGNTTAGGSAGTSLGKFISTTQLTDATLDNLFPDITGDENAADNVDYQCIFIQNNNGTLTLQSAVAYLSAEVVGGATVAIGVDPAGVVALGSGTAQAAVISTKDDAPAGVDFSAPTDKADGIVLGDIPPGYVVAIWVQRTATDSAAINNDGATVRVSGDTSA